MSKVSLLDRIEGQSGWWDGPWGVSPDTKTRRWWARREWRARWRARQEQIRGIAICPPRPRRTSEAEASAANRYAAKLRKGLP